MFGYQSGDFSSQKIRVPFFLDNSFLIFRFPLSLDNCLDLLRFPSDQYCRNGATFSFKGPFWTKVCFFGKKVPFFVFSSNNSRRWQRLILGILPQSFAKNGGAVHALIFLFILPTSGYCTVQMGVHLLCWFFCRKK